MTVSDDTPVTEQENIPVSELTLRDLSGFIIGRLLATFFTAAELRS